MSTKDLANSLIRTLKAPEECIQIYTKNLAILVSDLNKDLTLHRSFMTNMYNYELMYIYSKILHIPFIPSIFENVGF